MQHYYNSSEYYNLVMDYKKMKIDQLLPKIKIIKSITIKILALHDKKMRFITDFKYIELSFLENNLEKIKDIVIEHSSDIKKNFKKIDFVETEFDKIDDAKKLTKFFKKLLKEINHKTLITNDKFVSFIQLNN